MSNLWLLAAACAICGLTIAAYTLTGLVKFRHKIEQEPRCESCTLYCEAKQAVRNSQSSSASSSTNTFAVKMGN